MRAPRRPPHGTDMTSQVSTDWRKTHPPLELLRRKVDGKVLPLIDRTSCGAEVCTVEDFLYWSLDGPVMKPHKQWHPAERYEQSGYCGIKNERELK